MSVNKKFVFLTLFTLAFMTYMLIRFRVSNDIYDIISCSAITVFVSAIVTTLLSYKNKYIQMVALLVTGFVALCYGILSYINAYYIKTDTHLSEPDVFAVLQTNLSEAFFFFWENIYTLEGLTVLIVLPFLIFYIFLKLALFIKDSVPLTVKNIMLGTCCILILFTYDNLHLYKFIDSRIFSYIEAVNNFKKHQDLSAIPKSELKNLSGKGEIYVIVIGESQTRDYMQVFSPYPSITNTPWLLSKRTQPNWVFFDNSYSFHTHTVPSLSAALTDQKALYPTQKNHAETILSLSRRFGMKTIWISNQSRSGLYENAITTLANTADVVRFTEDNDASKRFDSEVVPILSEEIQKLDSQQNALFVIHLFGSHSPYRMRYPNSVLKYNINDSQFLGKFAHDKNRDEFMEYLTATQYTDTVLQDIFQELQQTHKPSLLMYFSDHGEDPIETLGHHFTAFQWSMSRIPFVIWLSDAYNMRYSHKLPSLINNKDKIFTNDLIFDAYSGFLNIQDKVYEEKFDIGSDKYSVTLDNAVISNNVHIKNDFSMQMQNLEQLMALDSNSIFKVAQAHSKNITSFQITANYTKDNSGQETLFVVDTAGKPLMRFEEYIDLTQDLFQSLFVEVENINLTNMSSIATLLEKLNQKYNIKERVFIGSNNLFNFSNLTEENWKVIYKILDVQNLTEQECTRIMEYKFYGINFQLENYTFIENNYSKFLPNIKYFAWNTEWNFLDKNLENALAPFAQIERIAITFSSAFSH